MDKQNTGITFPLSVAERWFVTFLLGGLGLGITAAIIPLWQQAGYAALCLLAVAAPLLYGSYLMLASTFSGIRLEPDALILYRFGKQRLVCPVREIKLFCTAAWYDRARKTHMLALCPYSEEQLTRLQEKKLAKGTFTRGELPFMKNKGGWEQRFARDYLLRRAKRIWPQRPGKRDLIWLPWERELIALLQGCYPQIPWLRVDETEAIRKDIIRDEDPLKLKRKVGEPVNDAMRIVLWFIGLLLLGWIVVQISLIPGMIWMLGAFMVPLLLISRSKDWKTLEFSAEQLRITDKQKQCTVIASQRLQTIVKGRYLLLSTQSVSQMAQLERQHLEKTARGRTRVAALATLSDCEQLLAVRRYHRMEDTRWDTTTHILMRYSPQREQTLRRLYPHAQWLDTAVYH